MSKRISTHNTHLNSFLVYRHIIHQFEKKNGLKRYEIELLLAVEKLTSGNLGPCIVSELKIFTSGLVSWRIYRIIQDCLNKGYLNNNGKGTMGKKFYLSLSQDGVELCRAISNSIDNRIRYLNDTLKLNALQSRKVGL